MKKLTQAYKSILSKLNEKYTKLTVILYHIAFILSFIPFKVVENSIEDNTTKGLVCIALTMVGVISAYFLIAYIFEIYELSEQPKDNKKSILSIFIKNLPQQKSNPTINILIINLAFIVIATQYSILPIAISFWLITLYLICVS